MKGIEKTASSSHQITATAMTSIEAKMFMNTCLQRPESMETELFAINDTIRNVQGAVSDQRSDDK
jgi:hypothetical protein